MLVIFMISAILSAAVLEETKPKTGVIINHIEDLGFEEYNELVKYLKIHNKSVCC